MTDLAFSQATIEQAKISAFSEALEALIDPIPETLTLADLALVTGSVEVALRPLAEIPNSDGTIPGREEINQLCREFYIDLRHKIEQLRNAASAAFATL